jgi:hypothetical protein
MEGVQIMNKLVFFVFIILFPVYAAAGNMDILIQCKPNFTLKKGYLDTESLATINASISGPDFISQSEWDNCEKEAEKHLIREFKLEELNSKGIEHICRTSGLCYESWNDLVIAYHDWSSMAPAARQPTPAKSKAILHYQPWLDAKTTLNNYTGLGSITFFNVSTMVSWP